VALGEGRVGLARGGGGGGSNKQSVICSHAETKSSHQPNLCHHPTGHCFVVHMHIRGILPFHRCQQPLMPNYVRPLRRH
jgi:hypothetical protein